MVIDIWEYPTDTFSLTRKAQNVTELNRTTPEGLSSRFEFSRNIRQSRYMNGLFVISTDVCIALEDLTGRNGNFKCLETIHLSGILDQWLLQYVYDLHWGGWMANEDRFRRMCSARIRETLQEYYKYKNMTEFPMENLIREYYDRIMLSKSCQNFLGIYIT